MTKPREWNRLQWGVTFHNAKPIGKGRPDLLGLSWYDHTMGGAHPDEPSRALLFTTRKPARDWCRAQREKYAGRSDCCKDWRFTPVRVREIVRATEVRGESR